MEAQPGRAKVTRVLQQKPVRLLPVICHTCGRLHAWTEVPDVQAWCPYCKRWVKAEEPCEEVPEA